MTFFLIMAALASVWLGVLAWSDCRYRKLPNYLTLPGVVVFPVMYFFSQLQPPRTSAQSRSD